ncbi:MAG TPA: sulfite exporter TauE/SafE family protein [Gemmatimonadales bacterium]|nr:sulfite exporter TauE/SafE family protein [Gemmatimonadales bacterium]
MTFFAAWLSGLLGSVHCTAMCGGFATVCSRETGGLPAWHAGRIVAYMGLGTLGGLLGSALPGQAWLPALLATLFLVWFTAAFAGLVPEPRLSPPRLTRAGAHALAARSFGAHFGFGLLNGLLPCGLVYSGLALSAGLASPWEGAGAMAAFGLGTVPALSLGVLGLRWVVLAEPRRRRLLALLVLVTGCWAIWARTALPNPDTLRTLLWDCRPLIH